MDLITEIRQLMSGLDYGYIQIQTVVPYKAWVFRDNESTGVFIPYEGETVNEEFSSVLFSTREVSFASGTLTGLSLSSFSRGSHWEFASVCANFVEPGDDGSYRKEIERNPIEWWKRWKALIGNSVNEPLVYSIIGELITYYYLLKKGMKVSWRGPDKGTHDFTYEGIDYEVKSTVTRDRPIISSSSGYQFQPGETKLNLVLCVFEESDNGYSIDQLVTMLSILGEDTDSLNRKLLSLGYKYGRSVRKKKYKLLSFDMYPVDDSFPYIDLESIERTGKGRISNLNYSIDLAGLDHIDLLNDLG